MVDLSITTKGRKNGIPGENLSSAGEVFYCLHPLQSVFRAISGTIRRASMYRVTAVSNINTSNNINVKELPDRAANAAHWSGPFVAAR